MPTLNIHFPHDFYLKLKSHAGKRGMSKWVKEACYDRMKLMEEDINKNNHLNCPVCSNTNLKKGVVKSVHCCQNPKCKTIFKILGGR